MIVMGGSLGGCDALCRILARLPGDCSLPIAVVLHRHRDSGGMLQPEVQRWTPLEVCEVEDKMRIEPRHVYLCPPDYHLMIDDGCFSLSSDDPVHYARPSIDVLFESAADWLGPSAIAVVVSGAGSDGSAGAKKLQARGGTVIVQTPATAEGLWMPSASIASTGTTHVLTLPQIAEKLTHLARPVSRNT